MTDSNVVCCKSVTLTLPYINQSIELAAHLRIVHSTWQTVARPCFTKH